MSKDGLKPTPFYDLVNVRMYPGFEQDLAMALGAEFDFDSINAYQRVDFADDCYISKKILQRRLRKIASAILDNIDIAISMIGDTSESQRAYMNRYREVIVSRCDHLLEQLDEIPNIEL